MRNASRAYSSYAVINPIGAHNRTLRNISKLSPSSSRTLHRSEPTHFFVANAAKKNESRLPARNTIPVVVSISPSPTNGDTSPPKANPAAPNTAEAVPALSRARFMASVVVDVNVSPSEKSMANSSVSYTQNGADSASTANSAAENATISRLP